MDNKKHTEIFNAYLARLSLQDLELIYKAQKDTWHAQQHYGNFFHVPTWRG